MKSGNAPFKRLWRKGLWRLADPKISLASLASMFLGASLAWSNGPLHLGWLAVTVLGILAIEVAKNASGEIVDFDSGADQAVADEDRSPFSGGKRVLVDGLLDRGQTATIAAVSFALGIALGLVIVVYREPGVLWLGVVGVLCAYFYHAWPARLAYRGLGELAVAICYGPLICCGTYWVQRGHVDPLVVWLSIPLGGLIAAFLTINEFPDYRADRSAGKRTLVARLGRPRAARAFAGLVATPFVVLAATPLAGVSLGSWLGFFALVPATSAARLVRAHPEQTARLIPAQARTLASFVLYALLVGIGVLFL